MNWTDGYNSETDYTYSYCAELNPLLINYSLVINGYAPVKIKRAHELGFGQGISLNFHAANKNIEWSGNDFMPEHVLFARKFAENVNINVDLSDQNFVEVIENFRNVKFDYICLHGVWSWISEENRRTIKLFIRENLVDGGVVFISYNCKPGWASMVPIRDLLCNFIQTNVAQGNSADEKTRNAIAFGDKLREIKSLYIENNKSVQRKLDTTKAASRNYLAHEYFNKDWETFYFSEVENEMRDCKLSYGGSVDFRSNLDDINLTSNMKQLISEVVGEGFKKDLKDFLINQSFRKDLWVKGGAKLKISQQLDEIKKLRICLRNPDAEIEMGILGNLGKAKLQPEVYMPIISQLIENKVVSVADLISSTQMTVKPSKVVEAIHVLIAKNDLFIVHDEKTCKEMLKFSEKINLHIFQLVQNGIELGFMQSPLTGGAVHLGKIELLFTGCYIENKKISDQEIVQRTWEIIQRLGQKILKDGSSLEDHESSLKELSSKLVNYKSEIYKNLVHLRVL